jgi:hypothetical protein
MQKISTVALSFLLLLMTTGCEAIGDIFGAGVYTGIFLVVFVIIIIVVVISKISKR